MVIKNIILTFVAVFAVLGISADRLKVADPVLTNEAASEVQAATVDGELASANAQAPVTNVDLPTAKVKPAPVSFVNAAINAVPATAPVSKIEKINATQAVVKPLKSITSERPTVRRSIIGVPKIVNLPEKSRGYLVSEWLDVPSDVVDRVKALPAPTISKPSVSLFAAAETTHSSFSTKISVRELSPLLPKVLVNMPSARPIASNENATLKSSGTIFARQLSPLLPRPAMARPAIRTFALADTTGTNISSVPTKRQLSQLFPDITGSMSKAVSFELSGASASITSLNLTRRRLLPVLEAPAIAKPTVRSLSMVETASMNISSSIAQRPLSRLLVEPLIAKPSVRSSSPVETMALAASATLANRPLQMQLPQPVIARPSTRSFSLVETTASFPTSTMTERPVQSPLPAFLFRPSLIEETRLSQGSMAIGTRSTLPLLPGVFTSRSVLEQTTASSVTSSPLSRELQKLVEAPVLRRQTLQTSNTTAVSIPVSSTIDPTLTAANFPTVRDLKPALISSQSVINPYGLIPVPSEMSGTDAAMERGNGPSIENSVSNEKPGTLKANSEPLPLLITTQNGFSTDMLRPMSSKSIFTSNPNSGGLGVTVDETSSTQDGSYCDPNFVGPPIRFSQTIELKLEDLLNQLNSRFGVNFIIGPGISDLPLNVKAGSIPWNVLLRSQLYVSGVRAQCIGNNTVELVLNSKVAELEKAKIEAEKLVTKYIKLKYLQPSTGGNKNVAGQSTSAGASNSGGGAAAVLCQSASSSGGQGGAALGIGGGGGGDQLPQRCKFERLMSEIRQILGLNERTAAPGDTGLFRRNNLVTIDQSSAAPATPDVPKQAYVGQVPGRNMLIVNATGGQLHEIDELIKRADVPPWQVVIKGLVYTANEDKLLDIGVQTTIANLGKGDTSGGLFGHTLGALGTLFDFSTLIGTVQFQVQANAFQRDGVISIKSRPFATVLDGNTTDLTVGRQVPVLIQAINPIGGAPGTLEILQAANLLSVTPHVIDDDQGNPVGVNLELQLESNDVDQSVDSQGVPAISVRSIQSNFNLNLEQTAILGGFTVDSDSKTISKTPGLGAIPIIGELFKRRVRASQINRLYFAISVSVLPWGGPIEPVTVPGATTLPPSLTRELLKRANAAEPNQVVDPK